MEKILKKRGSKAGLPPGAAVFVGKRQVEELSAVIMDFNEQGVEEGRCTTVQDIVTWERKNTVLWIDVVGLHEAGKIEEIGEAFGLHALTVEDILNTSQRPKIEIFDTYLYIVMRTTRMREQSPAVERDQVSFIIGDNFLLTFQEKEKGTFDPVRDRIRDNKGKVRKAGVDYLAYTLFDTIVDHYFGVLEVLGEEMEELEELLVANPEAAVLQRIHALKKEMLFLRKSIWPLRDIFVGLDREEDRFFQGPTKIFLRDLYDHTIQVIDTVETNRDLISGLLDLYLSTISNKLNEVMKMLTIYTAIFIPLSFIAGVYGMNFDTGKSPFNMPELSWYFGYPFALGLMAVVALSFLFFFKKKKWL